MPLIRTALSQIASTSPVMRMKPDGTEQRCIHCRVLIDLARETLGHQPWPAAPGTAVEPLLVLTDATQL